MKFVAHQKEFMESAGQTIDRPNKEQTELYLREMLESVGETMIAANPLRAADIRVHISKLSSMAVTSSRTDRVGLFSNIIGVLINAAGTAISAGLPLSEGWKEVHRARMSTYDGSTTSNLAALLDQTS